VVGWAKEFLPRGVRFVGSHPIAGSDRRGVQYARADLFDGASCVLTPASNLSGTPLPLGEGKSRLVGTRVRASWAAEYQAAVASVESFWQSLGMWTCRMTPARHDRCLAQISHLPHAAAVALMLQATPPARELAGTGFLDCTRIAGGDPELWRDIFLTNSAEIVRSIKSMTSQLNKLAGLIARGNSAGIVRLLAEAQKRRQELMDRHLKGRQVEG
jgi:prephenate dehydrogenase